MTISIGVKTLDALNTLREAHPEVTAFSMVRTWTVVMRGVDKTPVGGTRNGDLAWIIERRDDPYTIITPRYFAGLADEEGTMIELDTNVISEAADRASEA
jgi:hypothetical protein